MLSPEVLGLVAERLKALGDPTRLELLNALRTGEKTVSELTRETDLGQANVSKHLQYLYSLRFVDRRKDGLRVYYRIADEAVFQICDIICGKLKAEIDEQRTVFEQIGTPAAVPPARRAARPRRREPAAKIGRDSARRR